MSEPVEFDREAILAEIAELSGVRLRRPGEITVKEFQEYTGVGNEAARRALESLVGAGKMAADWAVVDGRRARVYWRIDHRSSNGRAGAS